MELDFTQCLQNLPGTKGFQSTSFICRLSRDMKRKMIMIGTFSEMRPNAWHLLPLGDAELA
ncbi:hypothetical protein PsorP6_015509 [Peronosclerospora sorghi]|uniref:Uncharacterized protein n=1 Tax=Peronosclerospora sorghi TaxID=230839 RepID=A0ACC0WPL0_9STRA|nr:hypothetical protein PsorP6_015509 [Peronosclerospora sorghi]